MSVATTTTCLRSISTWCGPNTPRRAWRLRAQRCGRRGRCRIDAAEGGRRMCGRLRSLPSDTSPWQFLPRISDPSDLPADPGSIALAGRHFPPRRPTQPFRSGIRRRLYATGQQDRSHNPEVKSNEKNSNAGSPAVGHRAAGRLWRRRGRRNDHTGGTNATV
ncbi:hypothetical protein CNECB9_1930004 [Cupriavidus necator]|uniref:Uncharacterized protein n=1 Tax=Cupriavidus necator TaxID=106590 RepID=A0A1K0IBH7_CUPNE|nr:hypothetical protein CNECB9_1930004 [Cupriavidus necator]